MLVNILMQPFGNKKSALITKALWLVQPENRVLFTEFIPGDNVF